MYQRSKTADVSTDIYDDVRSGDVHCSKAQPIGVVFINVLNDGEVFSFEATA